MRATLTGNVYVLSRSPKPAIEACDKLSSTARMPSLVGWMQRSHAFGENGGPSPEQRSAGGCRISGGAATVELELGQPDHGSDREDGGGARDLPGGLTGAADGRSLPTDEPAVVLESV